MSEYIHDQFDIVVFDKNGNEITRDTMEPDKIEFEGNNNLKFKRELTFPDNETNKDLYEGAKNHTEKIIDLHLDSKCIGKFKITFNDKEELVLLEQ